MQKNISDNLRNVPHVMVSGAFTELNVPQIALNN